MITRTYRPAAAAAAAVQEESENGNIAGRQVGRQVAYPVSWLLAGQSTVIACCEFYTEEAKYGKCASNGSHVALSHAPNDVDVDVEKSRAQAYASMPASCIANYI